MNRIRSSVLILFVAVVSEALSQAPVDRVLILDTSLSMNDPADSSSSESRMQAVQRTVVDACGFRKFWRSFSRYFGGRLDRFDARFFASYVTSPVRLSDELDVPTPREDTIDDRVGEVGIVEYILPKFKVLVGGDDHRSLFEVSLVDDLEEDVGGVSRVAEVPEFVDDEHVGLDVVCERLSQATAFRCVGEVVDDVARFIEERRAAVLNGLVGNGDREMCFSEAGLSGEDECPPFADEFGSEEGSEKRHLDGRLKREVEVLDRREEGKVRNSDGAFDSRLRAMGDLLGNEGGEIIAVPHSVFLRSRDEFGVEPSHGGKMESSEHAVEIELRSFHQITFLTIRATESASYCRRSTAILRARLRRLSPNC